jgi:hypothetical protein
MSRVLLAVGLFALAGCTSVIPPSTPEAKAVAYVEKLGGIVNRDPNRPGDPVVSVHLRECKVTDADLKELAPFTELASLNLSKTQVTDAGLKELARFQKLQSLGLRETAVTDAGIKDLAEIKSLTDLYFGGSKITLEGLKELRRALPKCEVAE